jgi:hypothetical protein
MYFTGNPSPPRPAYAHWISILPSGPCSPGSLQTNERLATAVEFAGELGDVRGDEDCVEGKLGRVT